MKGIDVVARILQIEGVEYLFSYPNNPIIDAAAKIGIRPIIARSEKTLINMADGYARATNGRRPTVLVVQQGSGIENAFGGFAQAFSDSIPMMMIPGGPDQNRLGGEFDPLPPFAHIAKWTARVNSIERVPELLRRGFSMLRTGPPGPVLVELPRDVGAADGPELEYTPPRAYRSAGDPAGVAEAIRLLRSAQRPMILAGQGVLWAEATNELRELAELVQAPVMTTMAGKSAFPEDHPLSIGTGANTITRQAATFLVRSDLVLAIGSGLVQKNNFVTPLPAGKRVVQITLNPMDVDKDYPVELAVLGDAKLVLGQLVEEARRQGFDGRGRAELHGEIRSLKEARLQEWMSRLSSEETPINPYRVIWDLNNTIDRANSIVTHDSGNPRDQTLTFFEAITPRGYLGWGKSTQLGTGYGVAMGAKLAFPDKLCINIMGDLAFGTAGMEVETAVRERIPIMTVILNNSVMGGYGHHMPSASERFGSNRLTGNYAKVAEGLGAYAERVERPGDVVAALQRGIEATRRGQPVVLEFITKEEPVYPTARTLIDSVAKELQPA
jgi:thiamine pyrophosphate-dependent acetolactate synthase large subunit-like protein